MKPSAIRIERMLEKLEATLVSRPRPYLRIIIHEGDDEAAAMEKALAEHVACHPEDAGRTVKDFGWIAHEIVQWPRPNPMSADEQAWLGHKNIQHTVRYTELAPDRFKNFWR
jgi:hypothetical protein